MSRSTLRKQKLARRSQNRTWRHTADQKAKELNQQLRQLNADAAEDEFINMAKMFSKRNCRKCFGRGYLDMSLPTIPTTKWKRYCDCALNKKG